MRHPVRFPLGEQIVGLPEVAGATGRDQVRFVLPPAARKRPYVIHRLGRLTAVDAWPGRTDGRIDLSGDWPIHLCSNLAGATPVVGATPASRSFFRWEFGPSACVAPAHVPCELAPASLASALGGRTCTAPTAVALELPAASFADALSGAARLASPGAAPKSPPAVLTDPLGGTARSTLARSTRERAPTVLANALGGLARHAPPIDSPELPAAFVAGPLNHPAGAAIALVVPVERLAAALTLALGSTACRTQKRSALERLAAATATPLGGLAREAPAHVAPECTPAASA